MVFIHLIFILFGLIQTETVGGQSLHPYGEDAYENMKQLGGIVTPGNAFLNGLEQATNTENSASERFWGGVEAAVSSAPLIVAAKGAVSETLQSAKGAIKESGDVATAAKGAIKETVEITTMVRRTFTATQSKLQHEFKHAKQFGVHGNWNTENGEAFRRALEDHINRPNITSIKGTYRGNIPVTHYYDPSTGLNVILDEHNTLIGAWHLSPDQINSLKMKGNVQ